MSGFPLADIDPTSHADLALRLQHPEVLDTMHDTAERTHAIYPILHRAIQLAAVPALDNPLLVKKLDIGVGVFEVFGGLHVAPETYDDEEASKLAAISARSYLDSIHNDSDFLNGVKVARTKLQNDTPDLADDISEVTSKYTSHDRVAQEFALGGAALIRGMQIFVDRSLGRIS